MWNVKGGFFSVLITWLRPGRDANPSPLLMPRSKIEYSYTSTLLKGLRGLWKGENYQLIS